MKKIIAPLLMLLASCGIGEQRSAYINTLKAGDTIYIQYGHAIRKARIDCIYREELKIRYTLVGYNISSIANYNEYTFENIHLLNQPCK